MKTVLIADDDPVALEEVFITRSTCVGLEVRRRSAACLTLSRFVDNIAALIDRIFVPSGEFFCGSRMRHHRSIADSRPGQLSNSAPEP